MQVHVHVFQFNYFWLLLASIRQALCSQKHLTLLVCSSSRLSRENLANLDVEGMDTEEETAPGTGLPGAGDYRKREPETHNYQQRTMRTCFNYGFININEDRTLPRFQLLRWYMKSFNVHGSMIYDNRWLLIIHKWRSAFLNLNF